MCYKLCVQAKNNVTKNGGKEKGEVTRTWIVKINIKNVWEKKIEDVNKT